MITFITAVLLIMAYVEIYGQIPQNPPKFNSKQEEYEYYCRQKNELTKQCQELKRQSDTEKQIQNKIVNGISNEIIEKKAENGGSAEKLLEWIDASNNGNKAIENGQYEQAKVYVESLTPAEDYVIEIEGNQEVVKLQSSRGFEAYTNSFSKSIDEYNTCINALREVSREYDQLKAEYITKDNEGSFKSIRERNKFIDEVNAKKSKMSFYENEKNKIQSKSLEQGGVILSNTTDSDLLKVVNDFLYDIENNNEVTADYENILKEHLKDCSVCGKK